jgi:type IV pilus assembly protein PilO
MAIGSELSKRSALLVLATLAFLAIAGVYWYFPYNSKKSELSQLSARVEVLDRQNQRAKADLASGGIAQLQAEAEDYARMFDVLRKLVPEAHEVPTLLEQLSTASRREGLELGGITPAPLIEGPEFDTHRYKIGVVGGYHQIGRFLANVGSLTRIVQVVDVTLKDRESMGGSPVTARPGTALVQADFEIRTWVARTTPMER